MTAPTSRFLLRLGGLVCTVSAVSLAVLASGPATPATPVEEVDAAYARLATTPHRKRETVLGPAAAMGGMKPMVTEVVGDRTRLVYEVDLPRFGRMRSECITVGSRRAVRTIAPEILAMIEKAKAKATVSSVRSLLNQLLSVAAAIQTGGMSTANTIQQAINAAATMKSVADARRVLGQAEEAFNSWQLVPEDETEDFGAVIERTSLGMDVTFVGMQERRGTAVRKYLRRPPGGFPGMPSIDEHLFIDANTGMPVAEETVIDGRPMMRVEYFDHGAAIAIELPDCLR